MTRSVRIHEFGDADVLRIEDVAVAAPGPGQVRLAIKAIGLNRTEITLRAGRAPVRPVLPAKIGFEAAGVIDAVGPGVAGVEIGDRVALIPAYGAWQYALYSEIALAPAGSVVRIPDDITFVEAAATWAAYGTAWGGLVAVGGLQFGSSVLISAASGSVGLAAIQTVLRLGGRPIALTRSREKAETLSRLGAAHVISTSEQDVVAEVLALTDGKGAELIFDPVGGPQLETLAKATMTNGTIVLYGALASQPSVLPSFDVFYRNLTVRGLALTKLTQDAVKLEALKKFVSSGIADGSLRPTVARTFPLDKISEAHRFMEAGEHVGKIIIET